MVACR